MASKKRTRAQARKDRSQLKRLKSSGLYRGKIDTRKAPSRAQKSALRKYAGVISGRDKVLKPKNPKSYKGTFRVVGDKIIVPKRKGERVKINKAGQIEVRRKIGGRKRKGVYRKVKDLTSERGALYVLPLQHGDDINYYNFDSLESLREFVFETSPKVGQTFKNWASYVLKIDPDKMDRAIERGSVESEEEYFDNQLARQLARRRRKRKAARK